MWGVGGLNAGEDLPPMSEWELDDEGERKRGMKENGSELVKK